MGEIGVIPAALVAVEWAGLDHSGGMLISCCPQCDAFEVGKTHGPRCLIDAALVELGLPTQVERDEVRAQVALRETPTLTDIHPVTKA